VRYADLWLQPRLGTDVALINGLIRSVIAGGMIDKEFITRRVFGGMEAFRALERLTARYTPGSRRRSPASHRP